MIRIILLALLSVLLSGCNLIFKNSKGLAPEPQVYFPGGQELKMATAIYDGDTRSVQSMINDGVDLNRISKGGMTYLILCHADHKLRYDGTAAEEWCRPQTSTVSSILILTCIKKGSAMTRVLGYVLYIPDTGPMTLSI